MKVNYSPPTTNEYMECLQMGRGIPVYSGSVIQRGYGIGGIFRNLASGLLPLLPKVGKVLARTALGVGADTLRGVPFSKSIKKRTLETGKQVILGKRVKRQKKRPVKRIRKSDVFGSQ